MKLQRAVFAHALAVAALANFTGAPPASAMEGGAACDESGVRQARERFNQAIADDNFEAMAAIFSEDVVLVTGTDSDLYLGRSTQVELWRSDVNVADGLHYVRKSTAVSVAEAYGLAMEAGRWTGTAPDGAEVGGEYAAKWRCHDSGWTLDAEVFMTSHCTGRLCN